uniref:Putative secreted protein n=1 Tax=Anopheles darlingi TaxID=43151 RepID=A0A2M4DH39_ANODA
MFNPPPTPALVSLLLSTGVSGASMATTNTHTLATTAEGQARTWPSDRARPLDWTDWREHRRGLHFLILCEPRTAFGGPVPVDVHANGVVCVGESENTMFNTGRDVARFLACSERAEPSSTSSSGSQLDTSVGIAVGRTEP